jgi:hypothetical protein
MTNGAHRTVDDLLAPYAGATATTDGGGSAAVPAAPAPAAKAGNRHNKVLPAVPKHSSRKGF